MGSMKDEIRPILGRGTAHNPPNRFERLSFVPDPEAVDPEEPGPSTQFFTDSSKTIIAYNDSPDVGFNASLNPYRGCEHGCPYCYARPSHEHLGYSAGLDFETKILVKENAPELLRRELAAPHWAPQVVAISGVTDAYQPVERRLQLTRRCLQVFLEFRNPVMVVTKNHLITRDTDILAEMAQDQAAAALMSVTSLDPGLTRIMEPRTSTPGRRLAAIESLAQAGIPAGVFVAPVIPGLNDHEIPAILNAAAQVGASFAATALVRLPLAVAHLFEQWLDHHFPDRKEKVLSRIRSTKGGRLNDPRFGHRMQGTGAFAELVRGLFSSTSKRLGLNTHAPDLSTAAFRNPSNRQLSLFVESAARK